MNRLLFIAIIILLNACSLNIDSEYWNEKSGPKWVKLDDAMNERFSILTDELFARANINKNERILDIGCGGGETSFRASKLVGPDGYVMGADISETLLSFARKKFSNISNLDFNTCDAQNYKFEKANFDRVISRFGVMFFENPIEAFKNIRLSLKDDGTITCVSWSDIMKNEFFTEGASVITKYTQKNLPAVTQEPGPFAFSDKNYIEQILKLSGFQGIEIDTIDSCISTKDTIEKDVELLINIGPRAKMLSAAKLSERELASITQDMKFLCRERQFQGEITYKACLNYITATK